MSLAAKTNLIARDTAIPGLGMVLNPDRLRVTLEHYFPAQQLGELQATYLRYKPGVNCLVAYRLQLGNQWIDFYAKAFHGEDEGKLQKWQHRSGLLEPLRDGSQILSSMATILSVFPYDAKLRGLSNLAQLEKSDKLCQTLFSTQPESGQLRRLRYKPERRYVAQWMVQGQPRALVKAYAKAGYKVAYENVRCLQSRGGLRLAQSLGHSHSKGIISYEWLPGKDLSSLLLDDPDGQQSVLMAMGNALGELHLQRLPNGNRETTLIHIKAVLELVDWLSFLLPSLTALVQQIGDQLVQHLHSVPQLYQSIHGDFYLDQVVVMTDEIAILDLDCATLGDPMVDLGNFQAHLEHQTLQGHLSYPQIENIQAHLMTGYRSISNLDSGVRLSLYTALGLFFLAPVPFRYFDPHWPETTKQILERVSQLLTRLPVRAFRLKGESSIANRTISLKTAP